MKTVIYVLFFSLLIFGACSRDVISPVDAVVEKAVITSATPLPFMTKYDLAKKNSVNARAGGLVKPNFTEYGPYTVNGNLRKILTQHKTTLTSNQSYYPVGVYFCDIYVCDVTITIPAGALFNYISSSKTGYSDYTNQTSGVNVTQTAGSGGSTYSIATNSMVPIYNVNGQAVTQYVLPQDLTGTTFTYSYIVR